MTSQTPENKKEEYVIQTMSFKDQWGSAKDGKTQLRGSIKLEGQVGSFDDKAEARKVAVDLILSGHVYSAVVMTLVDGPVPERQVPASEDVLAAMVAAGQVPGVPADAVVRTEAPAPDNTIPFPTASQPASEPGVSPAE